MTTLTNIRTDWEVSQAHAREIINHWPDAVRVKKPEVRKNIRGVRGKRITDMIGAGMWIKPLGSVTGKSFSSVRDIGRRSLVVFAESTTTGMSEGETSYEIIRDLIRELFHDRRGCELPCELYSRVEAPDYDIDDALARKLDIDILEITSWFREDRVYGR